MGQVAVAAAEGPQQQPQQQVQAIKLFGKTIVPPPQQQFKASILIKEEQQQQQTTTELPPPPPQQLHQYDPEEKPSTTTNNNRAASSSSPTSTTTTTSGGGEMKRPDKIIPCPRCKSMDTKFCYFNNYNVNQPRHFCKGCQRYWTAGGALRNVPIGAGRRKAKPPGSPLLMAGADGSVGTNCVFDGTSVFDLDRVVVLEEWAAHQHHHHQYYQQVQQQQQQMVGGGDEFPAKRRRSECGVAAAGSIINC